MVYGFDDSLERNILAGEKTIAIGCLSKGIKLFLIASMASLITYGCARDYLYGDGISRDEAKQESYSE